MCEELDSDYLKPDWFHLSPQQRRIWAERQPGIPVFGRVIVEIDGEIVASRLASAIHQVAGRHEILRTRFERAPQFKFPSQVIEPTARINSETRLVDNLSSDPATTAAICAQHQQLYLSNSSQHSLLWTLFQGRGNALLCVSASPLCVDLRALCLIFEEIAEAYQQPKGSRDPVAVVQYVDYSEYRNAMVTSNNERKAFAEALLQSHYESCPEPVDLPFERRLSSSGARVWLHSHAGNELVRRLERLAAAENAPLDDVIATVLGILISRMAGRDEVPILVCHSGRALPELNQAVGRFEHWIPLCISANRLRTFANVLRDVVYQKAQTGERQDYFRYDANYASRFRDSRALVSFSYLDLPPRVISSSNTWNIADLECQAEYSKLALSAFKTDSGLILKLGVDQAIFDRQTAESLLPRLITLLESVADRAVKSVGTLNIVPDGEWRIAAMAPEQASDSKPLITDLIANQAERFGERIAVVCGESHLSYAELLSSAELAACRLRRAGVGKESIVAVLLDRSADAIVGMLATLKAGAAYVMLDPWTPVARLQAHLRSVCPACILTRMEYLPLLRDAEGGELTVNVLALDDRTPYSNDPAFERPDPRNLAYVIQTSGSTGRPKNVAITHHGLSSYVLALCRRIEIDIESGGPLNFGMVSAFIADLGNTAIYAALASGGCLHVLIGDARIDTQAFSAYVMGNGIDVLKIVPSHLQTLLSSGEALALLLHTIVLGGETFPLPLARLLRERAPSCRLVNHYGPTETTVGCLTFSLSEEEPDDWARSVPVGRPLGGNLAYNLNEDLMPVPLGAEGQIHIGGDGLARGYLMAPGLTAEKFIPNPFGPSGTRLYRTGDLMRQSYDGTFEFVGRMDTQVKIRGYRIETGEIEAVLGGHNAIHQVVVNAHQDPSEGARLVAYYVIKPDAAVTTAELRRHLEEYLPDYLIPSFLIRIDAIPLTPNGKIDRNALPAPDVNANGTSAPFREPTTIVEKQVAQIWRDVLGLPRIGLDDRFFAVGGHSLQATQIVARVRSVFKVDITLTAFFDNPTVAGLVDGIAGLWGGRDVIEQFAQIAAHRGGGGDDVSAPIYARDRSLS
jgi:amino acid adenylation domain-containing protein